MAVLFCFLQSIKQSQPSKTTSSYALEITTCHESMPKVLPEQTKQKEPQKKKEEIKEKRVENKSSKKVILQEEIKEITEEKEKPQEESYEPPALITQESPTQKEQEVSLEQNSTMQIAEQTDVTEKTAQEEDAEFIQTNFAIIRAMALRNLTYPRLARKRGWQGDVSIQIELTARGEIANAFVLLSSGKEILDDAALEAVLTLRSQELPKPKRATTLTLPIHFALEQE